MVYYDLQLRADGDVFRIDWNPDKNVYYEVKVNGDEIFFHMDDFICLENGFCLKDFFKFVSNNVEFFELYTACPFLDDVIKVALSSAKSEQMAKDIYYLELKRSEVIDCEEPGGPFKYEFFDFVGICKNNEIIKLYMDLGDILNIPIFLNEDINIISGDSIESSNLNKKITLGEFIKAIIDEVTFFNDPNTKNELEKILRIKHNDNDSDHNELINKELEAQQKKFEEMKNETLFPCKYCGEEARTPHFNKPADVCIKCFSKNDIN